MHALVRLTTVLCLFFVQTGVRAQEDLTINSQLWLSYYPSFVIGENLKFSGDAGYRTILDDNSWHMIYIRPSVTWLRNKNHRFNAGLGFFNEFNTISSNRFEIRPWQGFAIDWPKFTSPHLKLLKLSHWFRLEERISFLTQEGWEASFDFRARYKLSGKLDLCLDCVEPKFAVPFYAELFGTFFDIDEAFRNRSRFGIGLDINLKNKLQFELLFHWQRSRAGIDESFKTSDYIFQLKLKHKLDHNPLSRGKPRENN